VFASAAFSHGFSSPRADSFLTIHGQTPETRVVIVDADPAQLARADFDLARHGSENPGEGVQVVAGARDLARLEAMGLTYQELPLGFQADPRGLSGWSSLTEVIERLDALVGDNPDLLYKYQIGTSVQGRPIWTVRVSSTPQLRDPARPKVSLNGNHHAREIMTVEVCLDVLAEMVAGVRTGDPRFLKWINGAELYVTPVVNPDGYEFVFEQDSWWRKNRRENGGSSFGVDLNRNYSYAWGANDSGSSGRSSSDTYRGVSAASEPETQAMVALATEVKPLFNLSYHSYGEVVLYPYGYENAVNPEGDIIESLATELAASMTRDTGSGHYGKRSRLYPVNGLDRDWYYFQFGTYSFVPEISNSRRGFQPAHSWVKDTVAGLRGGWQYLLDRSLRAGLRGLVVDAETGEGLDAVVRVVEVTWNNGEIHRTDADGAFSRLLNPGSYHLEISADGYQSLRLRVEIASEGLTRQEIRLQPLS
jgi:hypothetical protein